MLGRSGDPDQKQGFEGVLFGGTIVETLKCPCSEQGEFKQNWEEDKRATTNVQNQCVQFFLLFFLLFCSP